MKVQITYTEVITRQQVIEVEMTQKEYKEYLKMSEFEKEQKYDLCASTCDEHHVSTEAMPIIADVIDSKDIKSRKFDSVEIDQEICFEENGFIETGVVCEVYDNKFVVRALRCYDNDGVMSYYDKKFSFYKTGTKTHSHYTYGNAIQIVGTI
jgi:hypothetical protein